MYKTLLTAALFLLITPIIGQEKLAEFTTEYASINGYGAARQNILVELYPDQLTLTYLDPKIVKQLEKAGVESVLVFPYYFEEVDNGMAQWYQYQDRNLQIQILFNNDLPSVSIKSIDDFTGAIATNQLFFNRL